MTDNTKSGWEPGGEHVKAAARDLTAAERRFVIDGCIHGSFSMATVRNLDRKGLFYLHIDSPNGRSGFMELTPLGLNVQSLLKSRQRATSTNPRSE